MLRQSLIALMLVAVASAKSEVWKCPTHYGLTLLHQEPGNICVYQKTVHSWEKPAPSTVTVTTGNASAGDGGDGSYGGKGGDGGDADVINKKPSGGGKPPSGGNKSPSGPITVDVTTRNAAGGNGGNGTNDGKGGNGGDALVVNKDNSSPPTSAGANDVEVTARNAAGGNGGNGSNGGTGGNGGNASVISKDAPPVKKWKKWNRTST